MAWDSRTIVSPSAITGMRPCGFMARNSGVSSPPKLLPASMRSCARPSSPVSHITFWALNELFRPHTLSIELLPKSASLFEHDLLPKTGSHFSGSCSARHLTQMLDQLLRRFRQGLEAAGAYRKAAVGPGIPDPDHGDLHRARAAACGDLRHHGNADVAGHHLADCIKIVEPRAKPQARAEFGRVARDMGMQRA